MPQALTKTEQEYAKKYWDNQKLRRVLLERQLAAAKLRDSYGPQLDELQAHYKAAHKTVDRSFFGVNPPVPPPSSFIPDPFVVGTPHEARLAKTLLDLDPIAKQNVGSITYGPTNASMRQMVDSGLTIDRFGSTNLQGVYDHLGNNPIGINPNLRDVESLPTLAHEIGHAAGYGEEGAQKAGTMMESADSVKDFISSLVEKLNKAGIKTEVK